MTIATGSRIQVPADVMVSQLGGESVLLNLATETYFGLDDVGTAMWDALRQSPTVETAFERLAGEYDVDEATLRSDLLQFLDSLVTHGLVKIAPGEMA